jgi:chain length determinant protein EpsF
MNIATLIRILYARWRIIAGLAGTAIIAALLFTLAMPKSYLASTDMIIDSKGQDPISGQFSPTRLLSNYIATQAEIVLSQNVASKIIEQQKLAEDPFVRHELKLGSDVQPTKDQLLNYIDSHLLAAPDHDSSVMTISFKSRNPEFAARMANAVAQAYIQTNLELRTEPAKQINQWYDQQVASLRKNLVDRQEALSSYQEAHGILADSDRFDLETGKLNELSSTLISVQAERLNNQSRSKQIADTKNSLLQAQALDNPQVQKLSTDLAQAQAHLNELGSQVGVNHPQYRQAQSDVDGLRQQLDHALELMSSSLRASIALSQSRETQLANELENQKEKVLQLNRNRNQLNLLKQEVDNAQTAYNSALARSSQTKLESLISQTDVAVLNTASTPVKPTSPKPLMNLLLATVIGLLLGTACVLCMEWFDRRIRSPEDFEQYLGLPVLAYIPADRTSVFSKGATA